MPDLLHRLRGFLLNPPLGVTDDTRGFLAGLLLQVFAQPLGVPTRARDDAVGIATRLRIFTDKILSTDGSLTTKTASLNSILSQNQKRQDEFEDRLTLTENRIRAQYT